MRTSILYRIAPLGALAASLMSITAAHAATPVQMDLFDPFTTSDETLIEENYNVDSVYDINVDDKSKLTRFYYSRPSEYGPYSPGDENFVWDPEWLMRSLRNLPDGRRPATGVVYSRNCPCLADAYYRTARTVETDAADAEDSVILDPYRSHYFSEIQRQAYNRSASRFGDPRDFLRTYSNYRNRLGYTTRW